MMEELLVAIRDLINKAFQAAAYMVGAYGGYAIMDRIMTQLGWAAQLNVLNVPGVTQ
jgi:hypothetical protein